MSSKAEILTKIEAFDIDGGDQPSAYPFAAKLAQGQGWSRAFAEKVIAEYRRYLYLAATREMSVCPSDHVDAAWHLHLTYTRSYWTRLCKETLGRDIHHDPSRGGSVEDAKHWRMYEATLEAYRQEFGHEPPSDVWPPVEKRFPAVAPRAAKRPLPRVLVAALAFIGGVVAMSIMLGELNPLELAGRDFFYVLIPAIIAATIIGRQIYRWKHGPAPQAEDAEIPLDWQEAAYLLGGPARLTSAALANLVEKGAAEVSKHKFALEPTGKSIDDLTQVERAVLAELPVAGKRKERLAKFARMHRAAAAAFSPHADALAANGLHLARPQALRAFLWALTPLAAVYAALGLPRLWMGVSAGRPVGLLVITMLVGLFAAMFFIAGAVNLGLMTWRGQTAVKGLSDRSESLKDGSLIGKSAARTAGLAVAVFGTAALAGSTVDQLGALDAFFPRRTEGSGGCGGGGCGGAGGGACGGGGGCGG